MSSTLQAVIGGLLGVPFGAFGGVLWVYLYRRGFGSHGLGIALIFYFAITQISLSAPATQGKLAFICGMWGTAAIVKIILWRVYRQSVEGGPTPL